MTRLKYERQRRGLSQTGLALAAQLNQAYVSQIERGRLIPTDAQLKRLAAELRVPAAELLKEVILVEAPRA